LYGRYPDATCIWMFTAAQIADWILSLTDIEKGDSITPLKLQKLLYYCQAWHYTAYGSPLFDERIEAWAHGPVVPSQFYRFNDRFRNEAINVREIALDIPRFNTETEELLREVMDLYGEHSGSYLEELTHGEDPWIGARGDLLPMMKSNNEISPASMIAYYKQYLLDGQKEEKDSQSGI